MAAGISRTGWITAAAVMVAWIALIRGAQALDGIVVVIDSGTAVIAAAGPVKLRPQVLSGARDFRAGFHADSAGKSGGNHYGCAAPGNGFKFHHAFIHVDFSKAAAVNFNVELGPADGNHGAGCADLEGRRSAYALLNLRANAANHDLEIFPAAGLGLLQEQLGVRTHQHVAAVRELQQQAAFFGVNSCRWWQQLAADRSSESLRGKLYADFALEIGNRCPGIGRAGGGSRRLLGRGAGAIQRQENDG